MGIDHHVRHPFLDRLGAAFGFEPPRIAGLRHGRHDRARWSAARSARSSLLGGNFLSASPDTPRTARALERCALTASISTKLNRTHLYPGARALILPCLARSEVDARAQFVTVEDSMSMVHRVAGHAAAGERRSCAASPRSSPRSARRCSAGRVAVARARRRLRPDPRQDLAGRARLRELQRARAHARRLPAAEHGARRLVRERRRPRALHGVAAARPRAAARSAAHDDDAQPRPVQHDDLRPRRSLSRHPRRASRGVHERADMVELGLVERQVVDLDLASGTTASASPRRSSSCRTTCRAATARRTSPRPTSLVPLDSIADRSNTPTSKSVVIRIRPR